MVKLPSDQRLIIAAIGESGEGKSTLLNLLLNSPGENKTFFEVSEDPEACTLSPRSEDGLWRGDPNRPITVIDTPGLGSEEGPEQDVQEALDIVKILKKFGHIDAFVIVLKSGQSRFLSQHQHMFRTFQNVFGEKFWENSIIDVSHSCDVRNKKNFDAWLEKLANKFPSAIEIKSSKVFIDAFMMENETLEEFYSLCKTKQKFSCFEFQAVKDEMERNKQQINSSLDDISLSSDLTSDERPGITGSQSRLNLDYDHSRPHSRTSLDHSRPHSRSSVNLDLPVPVSRSELKLDLPRPISRSELHLNLPYMPPLPPRSPTLPSRRRTLASPTILQSYNPSRSLTTTPRLPRSFMPTFSPTDSSAFSSTRLSRRSFRETSPIGYSSRTFSRETSPISFSCRSSRDTSPISNCGFKTIGLPTYLRTSFAHKFPFTKAMRSNRLQLSHANEDRILLESCDRCISPLPECQNVDAITRVSLDEDMLRVPAEFVQFENFRDSETFQVQEPAFFDAEQLVQQHSCYLIASENTNVLSTETCEDFNTLETETFKAKKTSEKKSELELFKPESLLAKTPFNLVKKALLPKIKYHWDQGFKQGPNGWQKVPVIKLKIKYNEEDQELLPPSVSVEGGRWCETKRVKLDGGKAKLKLRTSEMTDIQLRVVPLDKEGKQEAWVPEFLFTAEKETEEKKEGEKWKKAVVTPAMPE
eukprot:GFUD01006684.1.p1 GENE.GFUD01006684.1~~GFUD01006684.1.p1  ORF type:complete len:700 (+),score=137.10 GFUD01006684.1:114-2213(+)